MNDWQSIIGHTTSIGYLKHVLEHKTVPQCMVFVGPEHVGKRMIADVFSDEMKRIFPVSVVHHIDAWDEEADSYKMISIKEIRASITSSLYTSQADAWNITIIDGADHLSEEASNALLKVMEEPNARVLFILIVHRIQRVLPTILSRASVVRFRLVPSAILIEGLRKKGIEIDEEVVRHACGLPGMALRGKEELSRFDVKCFSSPIYKQLAVSSSLTGEDLIAVEIALDQMAHADDAQTKASFLSYSKHYITVHETARIGSLSNAYEHLFF